MKGESPKKERRKKPKKSGLRCAVPGMGFLVVPRAFLHLSFVFIPSSVSVLHSSFFILHSPSSPRPDTSTNGEIPALRPPHAELAPTYWEQHGTAVVLCGVLFLILVGAAIWFLTRPKPPVVVPPEVLARKALEPLGQRPEDGALLSQVSQILRHYVSCGLQSAAGRTHDDRVLPRHCRPRANRPRTVRRPQRVPAEVRPAQILSPRARPAAQRGGPGPQTH